MGDERLEAFANPPCLPLRFLEPLVQAPPLPQCEVCVIIPVRNEAEILAATLAALAHQTDLEGQHLDSNRYEIILLANNCSDNSAAIARRFARQHPTLALHVVERTLPTTEAYIGRVRQILMDEAYCRLINLGRRRGIIASTDGDTQVAPTWIAATIHEIACGADAVGGRILIDRAGRATLNPYVRACHLREVGYRYLIAELETYLDPDPCDVSPRHYQHYGASLAVTAEMYAQAGGLPPVRTPEDVAFYRALVRVNARFRHSPLVRVITSARQSGRTTMGLANQLNQWVEMGRQQQPFLVESAAAIAMLLQARHQLRILWRRILNGYQPRSRDIAPLAHTLGVAAQWLAPELMQPCTFGLLFERIEQRQQEEGIWMQRWRRVEITQAIQELRLRLDKLRQGQIQQRDRTCQHDLISELSGFSKYELSDLKAEVLIPS